MPHFTHESSGELQAKKKKLTCMKVAAYDAAASSDCDASCNRTCTRRATLNAAPSLLAPPHADAKALGAAAEDESEDQEYPSGDHEHNRGCGAIAIVLLQQQQKVVAAVIALAAAAAAGGVDEILCVTDVDIGQRRVAAAHHVENGLQLGETQQGEI